MCEAELSNRFCPSVSRLSVRRKKIFHIDPHKPSKGSQTIANSKKLLYVCLTEVKALRFAAFRLVPTFYNYSQHWLHLFDSFVTSESHQEQDTQCIWKLHAWRWPLGNSIFSRFMYFTDIMALVSAVFSSNFVLFITFGPTSPASQYAICTLLYIR